MKVDDYRSIDAGGVVVEARQRTCIFSAHVVYRALLFDLFVPSSLYEYINQHCSAFQVFFVCRKKVSRVNKSRGRYAIVWTYRKYIIIEQSHLSAKLTCTSRDVSSRRPLHSVLPSTYANSNRIGRLSVIRNSMIIRRKYKEKLVDIHDAESWKVESVC